MDEHDPSPASLWTLGTAVAEIDRLRAEIADNPWRETVRAIFDELHFGKDTVFHGQVSLANHIVGMIEERHRDYFCGPREHSDG
jgi:hypothetical protein